MPGETSGLYRVVYLSSQTLLKDPKLSSVVLNPHTKSSVKQKAVNDALAKEKMSPITVNLMSE